MVHRRFVGFAITFLLGSVATSTTRADATAEARRAIQTQYNKINAAVLHKDVAALATYYAADFQYTGRKGDKHSLSELTAGLKQVLARATDLHGKTIVAKITLKGDTATVLSHDDSGFTLANPNSTSQKAVVVSKSTSQDIWVKSPRGWLQKSAHQLTETRTLNGKPMPAGPGG